MSGILREWLATVAEDEIDSAINILRESYTNGGSQLDVRGMVSEGGQVTVYMGKGRPVQLIGITGTEAESCYATVSDGSTFIRAVFIGDGVRHFNEQSGRDLNNIRGGIIAIEDYHLTFSPTATPQSKLSLRIGRFQLVGGENSPTFGRPSDISCSENIQEALTRLDYVLVRDCTAVASRDSLPPVPQVSVEPSPTSSSMGLQSYGTQQCFFTQNNNVMITSMTSISPSFKPAVAPSYHLLNLLKGKAISETTTSISDATESSDKGSSAIKDTANADLQCNRILETARKLELDSRLNSNDNHLPGSSEISLPDNISHQTDLLDSDLARQRSHVSDTEGHNACQVNHTLFNGCHLKPTPQQSQTASQSQTGNTELIQYRNSNIAFVDTLQTKNPFEGLKRVPRKFVRISETQQATLESCLWYSRKNDSRSLYASIPVEARNDISAFVKRQSLMEQDQSDQSPRDQELYHSALEIEEESVQSIDHEHNRNTGCGQSVENERYDLNISPSTTTDTAINRGSRAEVLEVDLSDEDGAHSPETASKNTSASPDWSSPISPGSAHSRAPESRASPPSRHQRVHVVMPSSSPIEDEPIEMAVPYAVGDTVDESDEDLQETNDFGELPTLPRKPRIERLSIQVDQTPVANAYPISWAKSKEADSRPKKRPDDTSSDPIIPATFQDSSSQSIMALERPESTSFMIESYEKVLSHQSLTEKESENGDIRYNGAQHTCDAEGPLSADSTQIQRVDTSSYHPDHLAAQESLCSTPSPDVNASSRMRVDGLKHGNCGTQLISSSPERHCTPSPLSVIHFSPDRNKSLSDLKRKSGDNANLVISGPSKRRWRASAAAILREKDCPAIDAREMARASRHSFSELLFSGSTSKADLIRVKSSSPSSLITSKSTKHTSRPIQSIETSQSSNQASTNNGLPLANVMPLAVSSACGSDSVFSTVCEPQRTSCDPQQMHEAHGDIQTEADEMLKTGNQVANYWEGFKAIYPGYVGSQRNFTMALVYIEWLRNSRQLLHQFLFDDFIRVYASEYLDYIRNCQSIGTQPTMHGWEYYDANIGKVIYHNKYINLENLQLALHSLDMEEVTKYRQKFSESHDLNTMLSGTSQSSSLTTSTYSQHNVKIPILSKSEINGNSSLSNVKALSEVSRNPQHRKPFFETFSQLPSAKQDNTISLSNASDGRNTAEHMLKHQRSLSRSSLARLQTMEATPMEQNNTIWNLPWTKSNSQEATLSPILGSQWNSPMNIGSVKSTSTIPDHQKVPLTLSPETSQDEMLRGANRTRVAIEKQNAVDRVDKARRISFKTMIRNKRLSGELVSRVSTPGSTPTRRFCTIARSASREKH